MKDYRNYRVPRFLGTQEFNEVLADLQMYLAREEGRPVTQGRAIQLAVSKELKRQLDEREFERNYRTT